MSAWRNAMAIEWLMKAATISKTAAEIPTATRLIAATKLRAGRRAVPAR